MTTKYIKGKCDIPKNWYSKKGFFFFPTIFTRAHESYVPRKFWKSPMFKKSPILFFVKIITIAHGTVFQKSIGKSQASIKSHFFSTRFTSAHGIYVSKMYQKYPNFHKVPDYLFFLKLFQVFVEIMYKYSVSLKFQKKFQKSHILFFFQNY